MNNNPVQTLVSVEEFKQYREEVRKDNYEKDDEAPPGLDEGKRVAFYHFTTFYFIYLFIYFIYFFF